MYQTSKDVKTTRKKKTEAIRETMARQLPDIVRIKRKRNQDSLQALSMWSLG
jgi:hypothetical protein